MIEYITEREWQKLSYAQKVERLTACLDERIARWEYVYEHGCADPFWSDGVNLNLVRNHIIYYLNELADLKKEPRQMSLLDDIDIQVYEHPELDPRVPPIVDQKYMANGRELVGGNKNGTII